MKMKSIPGYKKPLFIMAPMDDVTDTVFRQVISECAKPDLCFSEFVNVDGLMSPGRERLLNKLNSAAIEPPLVAHIWGAKPQNFKVIADQIASGALAKEIGNPANFKGVDLNMGCPVKTVLKAGVCAGLIKNQALAGEIINATKKGAKNRLPVSVKTRLGYERIDPEWTQFLLSQGVDMLSVHLRTVKEMSLVPAHFEELERLVKERDSISPSTLLVANGDIINKAQGQELIDKYKIDGVMIGRGLFHDPFAFSLDSPWPSVSKEERIKLFSRHLSLYLGWARNPDKGVGRLNKYAKIYINGFDGAKEMREKLAHAKTILQMQEVILA
ncbi:MAG: tRNA dihydrouridine synthase [Candidatus Saccharimonadales bacterium]